MKTLDVAIQMVLAVLLPLAAQLWDRRRLTPEQRARVWNFASWGSAVYGWSVISMIAWVFVTRRGPKLFTRQSGLALLAGVGAMVVLAVLMFGLNCLVALALGLNPLA